MATPARKLILDDIFDTLSLIGTRATDKTAPRTISRTIKEWETSGGAEARPWIGFKPARETTQHRPFGLADCRLTIDLVGHVNGHHADERTAALNDLMDDVWAALSADVTRGRNAIDTQVKQTVTDEGDPDTIDSRGGGGSFVMVIEVLYQRSTGAS